MFRTLGELRDKYGGEDGMLHLLVCVNGPSVLSDTAQSQALFVARHVELEPMYTSGFVAFLFAECGLAPIKILEQRGFDFLKCWLVVVPEFLRLLYLTLLLCWLFVGSFATEVKTNYTLGVFQLAIDNKRFELLQYLCHKYPAAVPAALTARAGAGNTLVHYAARAISPVALDMVKLLISHGADLNAINNDGDSVTGQLFRQVKLPQPMLRLLLSSGVSANSVGNTIRGDTLLHMAARMGPDSLVALEILLAHGANIESVNRKAVRVCCNAKIFRAPSNFCFLCGL